jgi:Trypsin-co-occurring domain 2
MLKPASRLWQHGAVNYQGLEFKKTHKPENRTSDRRARSMTQNDERGIPLSEAIETLRSELQRAWEDGAGQRIQFGVSEMSLTISLVAAKQRDASGKVRWWVIEGGVTSGNSSQATQTLTLTLNPLVVDHAGKAAPMQIAGTQAEPGM